MVVTPVVSPPLLFLPALFTAYDYQKFRDDEGSSKSKAKESVLGASLGGVCAKKKKNSRERKEDKPQRHFTHLSRCVSSQMSGA
jgi:hypothetical protein